VMVSQTEAWLFTMLVFALLYRSDVKTRASFSSERVSGVISLLQKQVWSKWLLKYEVTLELSSDIVVTNNARGLLNGVVHKLSIRDAKSSLTSTGMPRKGEDGRTEAG
jgi:hypothetical protein